MRYSQSNNLRSLVLLGGACAVGIAGGAAWGRDTPILPSNATAVIGTLTCGLGGASAASDASPVAQGRDVLCQFRPGDNGPEETYVGSMQGVGKADVLFAKGAVIMAVKAPMAQSAAPGILQQSYSADATPKSAAAPLVGHRNKDIVLQPLNEEEGRVARGDTQPDGIIILIELTLKSSAA